MACPSLDELSGGTQADHAAGCARCKAILELAATRMPLAPCGLAEALIAARAAGSLTPDSEDVLLRHLETCSGCLRLAREVDNSVVGDAINAICETTSDLDFTIVPRENYGRGKEIGRGGMGRVVFAHDRRLGRTVAIKELLDARLQDRFEREARLTARLQHPAIVSVHEAGRWPSGEPFYAMKYVAGKPLHEVIAEKATLAERLALLPHFTTVAEAIAYAHSERVIHRDLKPHNILIGAFGETVVIDWGLAKELAAADPAQPESPYRADGIAVTVAGAGTPAYMAPEQARGDAPDEGVDIYALGATLHHLLAGKAPDQRALPVETPAELRAIVHKAMAPERAARYRTAAELADELKRFQTGQLVSAHRYSIRDLGLRWLRRHRSALVAIAALAGAVGLVVAARGTVARDQACVADGRLLAGSWDPAVRAAVERTFLASGRPYATDTFRRVATALDSYTARWTTMRKDACMATAVRHEQSEALLDLRMQCLDRRLGALRAVTGLFTKTPDGEIVDRAVIAVSKLDDIASCADAETIAATVPLPADPAARVEIASVRSLVHNAHALYLVGKYKPSLELLRPLVVEADRITYAPLQLEAYYELGLLRAVVSDWKGLELSLHRRLELAAQLKDDRQIAGAWISLILAFRSSGRADEALGLRPVAEVAVTRAGNSAVLRGRLLTNLGGAYYAKGQYAEAEKAQRQGIALTESEPEHDEIDLAGDLNDLGVVLKNAGKYADARAVYQRAVEIMERRLGSDHPSVAGTSTNISNLLEYEGKYQQARALNQRVLAVFEGTYGPEGADLAVPLTNLGGEEVSLGLYKEAVDHLQRAVAIREKAFGATHRRLVASLENLGLALAYLGRYDDAERALERARAIGEKSPGVEHPSYAEILSNIGLVAHLRGRCRDTIEFERRALDIYERSLSRDHPDLVSPLLHLGQCDLELGRPREAVPFLERALTIRAAKGGDPADVAEAQFALGRARWTLAHDDASALELVERGRAGFAALGGPEKARAVQAERWLAARRAR